jgi:pimeloyl-ACP methyl ester carboxylesterase
MRKNAVMDYKEVTVSDQKIAYRESKGKGSPILFIHGNSMSSLCFERQIESSLGGTYRLVALDLPGHGASAPALDPKTGYSLPAYADIVYEFSRQLKLDDAVLVGWSLGGHILLEAIGRFQTSAGLMIFGAPPVGKPLAANAFLPNPLMSLAFKNALTNEESVALTAAFFKPGARMPEFFLEDMKRSDGRAREAVGISIGQGNYADEVKIVAGLTKPLAVVHGEQDSLVDLSYIKSLSMPTLWRSGVQVVPDAGHTPQWEQPERFNNLLMDFIKDCDR